MRISDWSSDVCSSDLAGWLRNPDFNGAVQEGVGFYQLTVSNGFRMSAAKAFLRPAMKRPNLTVRTHAHVTRILFDGVTAAGVEYAGKGFCYKVRAEKEVILCGGVINSPQLLQL